MEQEEEDIALIEAYINKNLDEQALRAFEKRIRDEPEFANKLEDYQLIIAESEELGAQNFKQQLAEWERQSGDDHASFKNSKVLWRIAAVLLILLVPSVLWWLNVINPRNQVSTQELYTYYFSPYEDVISSRPSEANSYTTAMTAYNQKNYPESIALFQQLLDKDPNQQAARCYQAIAWMALGEFNKAIISFNQVAKEDQSLFREVAQWYLILAYIGKNDLKSLEPTLMLIKTDSNHMYFQEANELFERIKDYRPNHLRKAPGQF